VIGSSTSLRRHNKCCEHRNLVLGSHAYRKRWYIVLLVRVLRIGWAGLHSVYRASFLTCIPVVSVEENTWRHRRCFRVFKRESIQFMYSSYHYRLPPCQIFFLQNTVCLTIAVANLATSMPISRTCCLEESSVPFQMPGVFFPPAFSYLLSVQYICSCHEHMLSPK